VTAAPAPRVMPKSPLGVSVWTMVLLDKYLYGRPTHRFCEQCAPHGFPLAQGTLTDGLQRLKVLFEPLMPVLYERQMTEKLLQGDETRWEVCEEVEGKTGHRWYLWVRQSASVVYYCLAPGRGADVPQGHFAQWRQDLVEVVLVCDRYSAYKSLAKDYDALILAYGWAHVRRDFLKAARSWPALERWMVTWVDDSASAIVSMRPVLSNGIRDGRLINNRQPLPRANATWRCHCVRCESAARPIFKRAPCTWASRRC
jgi:transposase